MSCTGAKWAKEQIILFEDESVRVTDRTLTVQNTTYSLGDISSVTKLSIKPNRTGPALVFAASIPLLLRLDISSSRYTLMQILVSVFLAASGALWWKVQKTRFGMRLTMLSGISSPFQSDNEDRLDRVVHAVNQVIASQQSIRSSRDDMTMIRNPRGSEVC
jgi:uncharacterized protein DUF6232